MTFLLQKEPPLVSKPDASMESYSFKTGENFMFFSGKVKLLKMNGCFPLDIWGVILGQCKSPLTIVRVISTCSKMWTRFFNLPLLKKWRRFTLTKRLNEACKEGHRDLVDLFIAKGAPIDGHVFLAVKWSHDIILRVLGDVTPGAEGSIASTGEHHTHHTLVM